MLLLAVAALVAYGLWAIDGITRGDDPADPNYYVLRQALYAAVGVVGMAAMTLLGPGFWRRNSMTLYVVMIALLVIAPVFGAEVRNTRRWIDLGPFRFQPSEFGKLMLVLFLAAFLAERGKRIAERRTTLTAIGLAVLPILLVFLQPDFGTAIVYAAVLGAVLFVAGTSWGHIGRDPRRRGDCRRVCPLDRALDRRRHPQAVPARPNHGLHEPVAGSVAARPTT